jgi:hypothetical protein
MLRKERSKTCIRSRIATGGKLNLRTPWFDISCARVHTKAVILQS